jgi:hypothetical protein
MTAAHRGFLRADMPFSQVTDPGGKNLRRPDGESVSKGVSHVGQKKQVTSEARNFALTILRSAEYRKSLLDRVRTGTLPPNIEAMLWAYAYGRPMERVEVTHINPTAQLADLSLEELAKRAEIIARVLKEVGDVEATEQALSIAAEADERRRLEAVDGEIVDPSSPPLAAATIVESAPST